jgi:outer membrane biosynthesis protein TonB
VSKILLLVSLALLPAALCAQTADDHFHRGAQFYVFGDKTNAIVAVATGLQQFPDDAKLKALAEILAKEEEKQQQQQQQQNQDQEKEEQQQQEQPDQDQKQPPEKKEEPQQNQQQAQSSGEKKDQEERKGEPSQPLKAHLMTPQEAQQLLDSQKGEEHFLQFKPADRTERRQRPIKDW